MENASKALLIAGAILICIVLISVGMLVLNSTTDVTDQVGDITASQAAQAFNNQYINYAGTQKGSSVKRLIETIATNNSVSTSRQITVTFDGVTGATGGTTSNALMSSMSSIRNSTKYQVVVTGTDSQGYVTAITIRASGVLPGGGGADPVCPDCGASLGGGNKCDYCGGSCGRCAPCGPLYHEPH